MNLLGEVRRRARHIVGPVLGITLFAYFTYHVVQGDRGLIAWWKLSQQVETAQAEFQRLAAERAAFAHRVRLLQPDSLDPDFLEERARAVLGFAHPDDIVIFYDAPSAGADRPSPLRLRPESGSGDDGSQRFEFRYSFGVSLTR